MSVCRQSPYHNSCHFMSRGAITLFLNNWCLFGTFAAWELIIGGVALLNAADEFEKIKKSAVIGGYRCWLILDSFTQYRICLSSVPDDQPVILLHLKQCWMESTMAHKGICNVFAEHTCDIRILKKWDAELSTGFLLWWHPHKDILLGLLNVWKATCDVVWRPLEI